MRFREAAVHSAASHGAHNGVLWGVHGSLEDGEKSFSPFDAPNTHCLDHVDYVLIPFRSSGRFRALVRRRNKLVFCKLSLYPLFVRSECFLVTQVCSTTTFRGSPLAFWNPDLRTLSISGHSFRSVAVSVVPDPPKTQGVDTACYEKRGRWCDHETENCFGSECDKVWV